MKSAFRSRSIEFQPCFETFGFRYAGKEIDKSRQIRGENSLARRFAVPIQIDDLTDLGRRVLRCNFEHALLKTRGYFAVKPLNETRQNRPVPNHKIDIITMNLRQIIRLNDLKMSGFMRPLLLELDEINIACVTLHDAHYLE